jgi:hypothetical protein
MPTPRMLGVAVVAVSATWEVYGQPASKGITAAAAARVP